MKIRVQSTPILESSKDIKIYHTETQEDYDSLMRELKKQGIETFIGNWWKEYEEDTVVFVHGRINTTFRSIAGAKAQHPTVPIIKYKAGEKLEFTPDEIKIYHTETQEDFDALIKDLERQRIETLRSLWWQDHKDQTVVFVRALGRTHDGRTDTTYGSLGRATEKYPYITIEKYKADKKM